MDFFFRGNFFFFYYYYDFFFTIIINSPDYKILNILYKIVYEKNKFFVCFLRFLFFFLFSFIGNSFLKKFIINFYKFKYFICFIF